MDGISKKIDELQKMLRVVINGQTSLKQELLNEIRSGDQKLEKKIDDVHSELKSTRKELTQRVDSIGRQLAYLEESRITRIEKATIAS